jgi:exoribonuclease R
MVATNRCCARFLKEHNCSGPFVSHRGFRVDRKDEVKRFLERFLPDYVERDLDDVATYREIMAQLAGSSHELPLRTMANRMLARAALTTEPGPHMGMAMDCYSNCTSPLRKYTDYLVHRQIRAALHEGNTRQLEKAQLTILADRLAWSRKASREAEMWLKCEYLKAHVGEEGLASISHINSSGFTARLLASGIEGKVDLRKDPEKFSFDRWTVSLTSASRSFQLEQEIRVRIGRVDVAKRECVLVPVADSPDAPGKPA